MDWTKRVAAVVLGLGMVAAPAATAAAQGYGQGPPIGVYQRGPWEQPPGAYRQDLQRQAFRDGFDGARKDLDNRRRPDVRNRDEFRNYRGPAPRVYRQAFQNGYRTFWAHVSGRR